MSLSHLLWQDHQDIAIACLHHPFVQGIGEGSLPESRFAYYVGQDAFFLEAFARAYSIAAAKAHDWKAFQVFHNLAAGVLEELNLHEAYARSSEGVDPAPRLTRVHRHPNSTLTSCSVLPGVRNRGRLL